VLRKGKKGRGVGHPPKSSSALRGRKGESRRIALRGVDEKKHLSIPQRKKKRGRREKKRKGKSSNLVNDGKPRFILPLAKKKGKKKKKAA